MTRVLVLDDHPGLAHIICLGLEAYGYPAKAFTSPNEILAAIQPEDILVADYHMPEMNGLEVARRANAKDWKGSLVLMSGHPQTISEPIEHPQLLHFPTKPFTLDNLLQILPPAVK